MVLSETANNIPQASTRHTLANFTNLPAEAWLVITDHLTSCSNWERFEPSTPQSVENARSPSSPLNFAHLRLDEFRVKHLMPLGSDRQRLVKRSASRFTTADSRPRC